MVGEGEGCVGLVAVLGAWGLGPAREHGDAPFFKCADLFGADGVGRGNEDVARGECSFEKGRGWVIESGFVASDRHFGDGFVRGGGDVGFVKEGEGFLCLAEGVAEEDGLFAVVEGGLHEVEDVAGDFFAGRKDELGTAEGGLHDEDVGGEEFGLFAGEGVAQLVVAGVESGGSVGETGGMYHGGTEDVTGGEEADFEAVDEGDFVVGDGFDAGGGDAKALVQEVTGDGGAEDAFVAREVVCVRVGDEGEWVGPVGVEEEVEFRPVEGRSGFDFDEGHEGAYTLFRKRKLGRWFWSGW